jgi:hypothetical protein
MVGTEDRSAHVRRSNKNYFAGIVTVLTLTGCAATSPNVVPVGQDAYHLSVSGKRYELQSDLNLRALNAANDFCAKKNQHLMFRQSTESGDQLWSSKQEDLTFVCMDANDPAYMQASVKRESPVVAQQ